MQSDIVLSSRVRLARNYADLPFDLASEPEQAELASCARLAHCVKRDWRSSTTCSACAT